MSLSLLKSWFGSIAQLAPSCSDDELLHDCRRYGMLNVSRCSAHFSFREEFVLLRIWLVLVEKFICMGICANLIRQFGLNMVNRLSMSTKCFPRDSVGSGYTVRGDGCCHRAVVFVGFQGSRAMGTAVSVRFSPLFPASCWMLCVTDMVLHKALRDQDGT